MRRNDNSRQSKVNASTKGKRKFTQNKKKKGTIETASNVRDHDNNSLANDPMWYNVYPELVDSTARISTGYPVGLNYSMDGISNHPWEFVNNVHTMRLSFIHGIGLTENDRDPVNLAATKLYSFVRHANSGHSNYERTDLMLYFLSVIEAYCLIGNAIRAYGLINMYNNMNRAMPAHVIKAIGWNYEDLVDRAPQLRTKINNSIARLNSLYIPTELNVMKRWWWLNTTLFTDSAGPKAMIYACVPTIYRTWEEMNTEGGGYLKARALDGELTVGKWGQAIDKVLNNLLDSEDVGIMSGDILKAFGDRVYTLSMLDENYTTPFVYSEEVLMQINNTAFISWNVENLDITQEVGPNLNTGLRYNPTVKVESDFEAGQAYVQALLSDPVMSFPVENPDNNMVMVASRNIAYLGDFDEVTGIGVVKSGSEIFTVETICTTDGDIVFNPSATGKDLGKEILLHSRFDYCPLVKMFEYGENYPVYVGCSHYENVVPVGEDVMNRMHDTALLSLFTALVK